MYNIKKITVVTGLNDTDVMEFVDKLRDQISEAVLTNKETVKETFSDISDDYTFSLIAQYDYCRIYRVENTYYWFMTFPETNLHPHHQRKLARFLVKLINSYDTYVIIGTNSDFIVNEFNLCYYATRDKYKPLYKKYPLTDDQICGYEVEGRAVKSCEVTTGEGLVIESFNKEIIEQNQIKDNILWGEKHEN